MRKLNGKKRRLWPWILIVICVLFLTTGGSAYLYYQDSLKAVDQNDKIEKTVTIKPGTSPSSIADLLYQNDLIKNKQTFLLYLSLSKKANKLQSGVYILNKTFTVPQIVDLLTSGKTVSMKLTFFPGSYLKYENKDGKTPSHKQVLLKAGFSSDEIDKAFNAPYDHPLMKDRPVGADLEGYIWADTYEFDKNASLNQILKKMFDEYYKKLTTEGLIDKFKQQGLDLHKAIILASITQKEANTSADQNQIAQVFLRRLKKDIPLGSDVTFFYAALKENTKPSPYMDSLYNTRKYKGLPPGPISSPGITALRAVANPADGDYLYFVAGDDGKTHFSRTEAEHNQNVAEYCIKGCRLP